MFQSQLFLSKKGPLGSIWVAAYCLKRLHRDQILQTNIPSSVDKILTDEWPTVTYRILAYLLLGVVRIYSKKVEFVLHDCREIINELNKFVGKKKAVPFKKIVHAEDFSVTLPERYELDAFVLEYADDGNKAHIANKEDISIQGSFRNDKSGNCSVRKFHENVTTQRKTTTIVSKTSTATIKLKACSSAQNPPESPEDMDTCSTPLAFVENCTEFELGASSSLLVRSLEESIEDFREFRFSREECLDFEMFYQNDKEHVGIFKSPIIIQSANAEHTELITMMQTGNNDTLHSEAEEETHTAERNCDLDMASDNLVATEEKEANFTAQTSSPDPNMPSNNHKIFAVEDEGNFTDRSPDLDKEHVDILKSPIIIQSANVEHTELITMMQTDNDDILHSEAEEETHTAERNCVLDMPSDNLVATEEKEANFTVQTSSPDPNMPSNNHKIFAVQDEGNFTDRSPDLDIASDDDKNVTAAKKVVIADLKSPDLEKESQPDTFAPVTSKKEKVPLKVQTTPNLKIPAVKEATTTERLAVRTPANKEGVRKTNKRKCLYDDITVLSNKTLKHYIDDPSDLVRKRRRVPHSSLALWRQSCIYDLPQKFMEPLIPCNMTATGIVTDRKVIQVKSNDADQVGTVEAPANPVMPVDVDRVVVDAPANPVMTVDVEVEAPANPAMAVDVEVEAPANPAMTVDVEVEAPANPAMTVDVEVEAPANPAMAVSSPSSMADGGLSAIAPGTPVRCSISKRAFISPTAADSDGEGPSLCFQTVGNESSCQSYENARKDSVADSIEGIVLDLTDKDMDGDGDGDSQKQDGWSTRTRTIARWLHKVFASKTKRNESKTANLSQILDGKTRKKSARIFYEILVLGSGDYVNVSQEGAYKGILLQETQKMEAKLAKCAV